MAIGDSDDDLSFKEYRYREPERKDFIVALAKIGIYGPVFALLVWLARGPMIDRSGDWFVIITSLCVMAGVMVVDALLAMHESDLSEPGLADLFFPAQAANWGLLPGPLLYIGAFLYLLYKLVRMAWGARFG